MNGYHTHKYCPYLDGTLSLYCQFCGDVITPNISSKRTKLLEDGPDIREDSSEEDVDGDEDNETQDKEGDPPEVDKDNEEYQTMEAELLRQMQELYPNQYPTDNIAVRPEFSEDLVEEDDYEGLIS
jgi:hypothetical protein